MLELELINMSKLKLDNNVMVSYLTCDELLKWIRLQTCKWTTTIMCQTIKQGFPNHGIDKINRQRRKDKQKQWL